MSEIKYTEDQGVQWMLEFQHGNKQSFEKLMVNYYPRVLNFIYRYMNNQEAAEDLTQEVFVKVYKNAYQYTPQAKLQTWIFTIAKNISLNELRKYKQKMVSLDQTMDTGKSTVSWQIEDVKAIIPDKEMINAERSAIIRNAIEQLPKNQRVAVLLRRFEQMSYSEISKSMGTTQKAVKSLLNRAKENLKESLSSLVKE